MVVGTPVPFPELGMLPSWHLAFFFFAILEPNRLQTFRGGDGDGAVAPRRTEFDIILMLW